MSGDPQSLAAASGKKLEDIQVQFFLQDLHVADELLEDSGLNQWSDGRFQAAACWVLAVQPS
jgi:hypothetical protein